MASIRIINDYVGLYRVPKDAIIDFLLNKSEDAVVKSIHKIDDSKTGKLLSILTRLSFKEVLYVFQECSEATQQEA